jgi:hypothetical protein
MVFPLIIGALSVAGSAIVSAVAAIGPAISSFVATVGPVIANIIETIKPIAELLSKFANIFLQTLSILKQGENIEDFGERALQATEKGIKLSDFDDFNDYMDALRNFELDPEISKQRSQAEKLLAGLGIATIGVEDQFGAERGSFNGLWLLPMVNPQYFTPDRVQSLLSTSRLGNDVLAYLGKSLSGGETRNFEKSLETGEKGQPLDEGELDTLYGALDTARETWATLSKQVNEQTQVA